MSEPVCAESPQGRVQVVVVGGFLDELELDGAPDASTIKATINDALLGWYERERATVDALDAALQRADKLTAPSVVGQTLLADPPAWVEKLDQILQLGTGEAGH